MHNKRLNQRGSIIIVVAVLLTVFFGIAALAVDIGHITIVRNELQNAADAAALFGASSLTSSPTSSTTTTAVQQAVTSIIEHNKSDSVALTGATVSTGWWDLASPSPQTLASARTVSTQCPAVQVTVSRSAGNNGGPVQHWFASVIGISTSNVSATATAVIAPAGTALPGATPGTPSTGGLLPVVIGQAVANQWSTYNSPSSQIKIGSDYHYPTDAAGQWTSFLTEENDVPDIENLISTGNTAPVSIGNSIWTEPGTKTALFTAVAALVGQTVLLPVVAAITPSSWQPVVGFIGFHITDSEGGSSKYIEGYFVGDFYAGSTSPTGGTGVVDTTAPYTYVPPSLVQ